MFDEADSDEQVLAELGERLARIRLERELTQAELARQAGISKRTLERLEAGQSTQLLSLVRVLRVLGLLPALDTAVPELAPSPLQMLKLRGSQRQRAPRRRSDVDDSDWSWGE